MKYVNFKKVSIKNFLSVGETPVEIDFNKGLNIITGSNKDKVDRRNGVGKSTVADSIYFAIFGTTLRELKKDHIINNVTQRGCEVELQFTINNDGEMSSYVLNRQISPTKCTLFKDGEDITRDSMQNTTEYVCDMLNTTPEVFQNCVIMTINNATPFMAKKKLEKRKFIEGIFNLQVFSNMLTMVRQDYNTVARELDVECTKFEEISNSLNAYMEQRQTALNDKQRSLEKLKLRDENNDKQLIQYEKNIADYKPVDVDKLVESLTGVKDLIRQAEEKIQNIMEKKISAETTMKLNMDRHDKIGTDEDVCPVCLSKMDNNHKEHIESEKKAIKHAIESLNADVTKFDSKLKEAKILTRALRNKKEKITTSINESRINEQEIKNTRDKIAQIKSQKQDIQDDIESLNKLDSGMDVIISKTEKRLNETQQVIDQIKKKISRLDIIKFIVSEEGVKSYIVKKMLQLFNAKLSHYLKKMDSNCICVFNEYFEEEIIDEKGKPCSYFNFSGAERKNIDLACLFAFMDIRRLQGDIAFNFSMYDELFDSSLDERGVELVIEILKERIEQHDECVMVISHRKESTKLATGEIIFLEKQKGVTTRIETPVNELK